MEPDGLDLWLPASYSGSPTLYLVRVADVAEAIARLNLFEALVVHSFIRDSHHPLYLCLSKCLQEIPDASGNRAYISGVWFL